MRGRGRRSPWSGRRGGWRRMNCRPGRGRRRRRLRSGRRWNWRRSGWHGRRRGWPFRSRPLRPDRTDICGNRRRRGRRFCLRGDLSGRWSRRRDRRRRGDRFSARRGRLTGQREGAVDLRLDEHVVRAADHDEMFDIVATHQDQLALPIEAECIDKPQPRLAGSASGNAQPMRKHQPVNDRQNDQRGDPAGRQKSDLNNAIIAERKITKPLHAKSNVCAADCANQLFPLWRRRRQPYASPRAFEGNTPREVFELRQVGVMPRAAPDRANAAFITKRDPVENCGFRPIFARIRLFRAET